MIFENIQKLRQKLSKYPHAQLICVTKGQPVEKIQQAIEAGEVHFGANYSQELLAQSSQIAATGQTLHWHFIGHLQRNKVKQILPLVDLIHSVDSLGLAQEINKRALALGKVQNILIEINLEGESSKTGLSLAELTPLITELNSLENIELKGLMCIPPALPDPEHVRPYFKQLREIREDINQKSLYKKPLTELSMGMSQDYEIALEEGSTMIRIGTAIFGERHVKK